MRVAVVVFAFLLLPCAAAARPAWVTLPAPPTRQQLQNAQEWHDVPWSNQPTRDDWNSEFSPGIVDYFEAENDEPWSGNSTLECLVVAEGYLSCAITETTADDFMNRMFLILSQKFRAPVSDATLGRKVVLHLSFGDQDQ